MSIYRPKHNDDVIHRIKVDASTFDGANYPKVFIDWLADINYFLD